MEDKVTLYIATHNKTGMKYFGKSSKYFTQEDIQKYYHGSGKHWTCHLKKHGDDVTMTIYKICSLNVNSKDYVKHVALKFSEENDIVESNEWANLIPEDGTEGRPLGAKHTNESRQKMRDNTNISEEQRKKSSEFQKELLTCSCGKTVNRLNYNRYHGEKCKDSNEFKKCSCLKCKRVIGLNNIKSHTNRCYDNKSITSSKTSVCKICNNSFSVYGIKQHEKSCGVEKPQELKIKKSSSCLICKREITNANIKRHLNSHLS